MPDIQIKLDFPEKYVRRVNRLLGVQLNDSVNASMSVTMTRMTGKGSRPGAVKKEYMKQMRKVLNTKNINKDDMFKRLKKLERFQRHGRMRDMFYTIITNRGLNPRKGFKGFSTVRFVPGNVNAPPPSQKGIRAGIQGNYPRRKRVKARYRKGTTTTYKRAFKQKRKTNFGEGVRFNYLIYTRSRDKSRQDPKHWKANTYQGLAGLSRELTPRVARVIRPKYQMAYEKELRKRVRRLVNKLKN